MRKNATGFAGSGRSVIFLAIFGLTVLASASTAIVRPDLMFGGGSSPAAQSVGAVQNDDERQAAPQAAVVFNGTPYTQDFQSITATSLAVTTIGSTTMTEVSTLGGGGTVDGWYVYYQSGSGTPRWARDNGSSSTGSFYGMFDGQATPNRALGAEGSNSKNGYIGVVLRNTTGSTINTATVNFDAMMNRNPSSTVNAFPASYRVTATAPITTSSTADGTFNDLAGTWIPDSNLSFSTPTTGTGAPGTQANISPLFRIGGATKTSTLSSLSWGNNQYLYIRWKETDETGSDAMAGVDNFNLTIADSAPSVTTTTPTNGATGVLVNSTVTVNFSEAVNLTASAANIECPTGTPITFSGLPASSVSSVVLTPSANLPSSTVCTVTVVANQVTDVDAVDPPDNMAANFVLSFTTAASANTPPTILESTTSTTVNLPATGPGSVSAVLGDSTDPVRFTGLDFTVNDAETAAGSLTVTAVSSNTSVVPNANITLTNGGATRNMKITPAAVGYSNITVTVSDGSLSANYVVNYAASVPVSTPATTHWHTGRSDASTAQAIDSNYMFVGDDEDQGLRLFDRNNSGLPLSTFDFTTSLNLPEANREVDIEGSARSANTIYWIGSHGNSSSGGDRPNRSRLFTTTVSGSGSGTTLTFGGYYGGLKADLINWDNNNDHGLGAGFLGLQASTVGAPEQAGGSGFNIEGLEFAPDGTTLYVCFRAPLEPVATRTHAMIVPVTNASTLVSGSPGTGPATFGTPIFLNLGGRGIRELRKNSANEYIIVAGSFDGTSNFQIYSWNGNAGSPPQARPATLTGLRPESVVEVPTGLNSRPAAAVNVQFLSDNGDDIYYNDGIIAKDLLDNNLKKFRNDLVNVGLAPSAANAMVTGRLLTELGSGVGGARVEIRNADGVVVSGSTNAFGYFVLENIPAGDTYVLTASSKRYAFAPRIVDVAEDVTDLTIFAEP